MTHLDTAGKLDGTLAARAAVAGGDGAQIAKGLYLAVAEKIHVAQMGIALVGANHVVRSGDKLIVRVDRHFKAHWTGKAHGRACHLLHSLGSCQLHFLGIQKVLHLHVVDLAIPAHKHSHGLAVHNEDHGLHDVLGLKAKESADLFHSVGIGGCHLFHGSAGILALCAVEAYFRALDVGRVVADRAGGYGVLACVCKDVELVGEVAANGAGVRLHSAKAQAKAGEDVVVGLLADHVGGFCPGIVQVKAVAVLHDELAAAHEAEAGADLVAELGLDLEQARGQLPVGADLAAHKVGDDLLVRGAKAVVAVVAVLEAQKLLAVVLPAPGLLPEIPWLHCRQEQFLEACCRHFLADDILDLL